MPLAEPAYTAQTLLEGVTNYLASLGRTEQVENELGWPIYNDDGKPIMHFKYYVPPNLPGLCDFLHISKMTWNRYAKDERTDDAKERARVCAWFKLRYEGHLIEELETRENVGGIKFILANNFSDWNETHVLEAGEKTRETVSDAAHEVAEAVTMSLSEKIALVRQAAEHLDEDYGRY